MIRTYLKLQYLIKSRKDKPRRNGVLIQVNIIHIYLEPRHLIKNSKKNIKFILLFIIPIK